MPFTPTEGRTSGAGAARAASAPSGPRAGFGPRLYADLIDGVIIFLLAAAIKHITGPGLLLLLGVGIVYTTVLEGGARGQTLGKMLMHIRVVRLEDGHPLGYGLALVRTIFRIMSALGMCIGHLWMLMSAERQALHDVGVGAVVVPTYAYPAPGP